MAIDKDQLLVWLQLAGTVLIALTFLVYLLQWRTMQRQLAAARDGIGAQNLFALIAFLQDADARDARAWVLQRLGEIDYSQWSEQDKTNASRVCSKYDAVGMFTRLKIVPLAPVVDSWGPSIRKCYLTLSPFVADMRVKNGQAYWNDFEWLFMHAGGAGSEASQRGAGGD
jgi:hypothetical protein